MLHLHWGSVYGNITKGIEKEKSPAFIGIRTQKTLRHEVYRCGATTTQTFRQPVLNITECRILEFQLFEIEKFSLNFFPKA